MSTPPAHTTGCQTPALIHRHLVSPTINSLLPPFICGLHFHSVFPIAYQSARAEQPVLVHRCRRSLSRPPEKTHLRPQVLRHLCLDCRTECRSSLLFFSGCLFSSGLRHGMEGMMVGQTRGPDLEDDLACLYTLLYIVTVTP